MASYSEVHFKVSKGACAGKGKRDQRRLANCRATDSPYIYLTVCCTAIRLLRDASVAELAASVARSA